MKITKEKTIGQIVADDYRTAKIFRTYGLDFCCGGNNTIKEAAAMKKVNPVKVRNALQELNGDSTTQENYNEWAPDFLTEYIINNHHRFTRNKMPEIVAYANKVAKVHGGWHPELNEIYDEVTELHADIIDHLNKEENILFPYIKELVEAEKDNTVPNSERFGMGADPVSMMEEEHEEAGDAMARIRALSSDFCPPEDACTTYRVLFKNLAAFEKDLHKHVYLENNILFPKALEIEKKLSRV